MNNKQAIETVYTEYLNFYDKNATVAVRKVDENLLKEMLKDLKTQRFIEERYEFHDSEDDNLLSKNQPNWIDVEGEGYGWVWLNYPARKWHSVLRKKVHRFAIRIKKDLAEGLDLKAVVVKHENIIVYHFIERDTDEVDTVYTFSKDCYY